MSLIKNTRIYSYLDEYGKDKYLKTEYQIVIKDNKVINVFNEYGFSVEKNSDVFEYYSDIYNN